MKGTATTQHSSPRSAGTLLSTVSIEGQGAGLQILAGPLPEVERSERGAGEIEDLLSGAGSGWRDEVDVR